MRTEKITINRNDVWLTFDNLRIDTNDGPQELNDKIICYYKLTESNDISYGQQIIDSNDTRLVYASIDGARKEVSEYLKTIIYPPNFLHPLNYKKEQLEEIMNKTLTFDVGTQNSDEITETIIGSMTNCTLAGNPPYLPGIARITLQNGNERSFNFFQIKRIRKE